MENEIILELNNVCHSFDCRKIIDNFSLQVKSGEIICLVGPSGCGKSTLLKIISNIITPDSGKCYNNYSKIGYVFQEDRLLPWKTISQNIQIVEPEKDNKECELILDKIGLLEYKNSYPNKLSGGMKQRISIGRGFFYDSPLLLMDEPFKSLDYALRQKMLNYLLNLWKIEQKSIIFVTHEIDEAISLGNRILLLSKNPMTIEKEFILSNPQGERDLTSNSMLSIRNEIFTYLNKYI